MMYTIAVRQEWDQWVAKTLENNVSSFGDTKQEALDSVQEALTLYAEDEQQIEWWHTIIRNLDFVSIAPMQHA